MKAQSGHLDLLLPLLLVAMTIAAFLPAARCGFNLVDNIVITEQPHVRTGLSAANAQWALTAFELGYPIPVTLLSFMLDAQLFGLNPAAFHSENVAWHAANVVLLYLLLRRLTGSQWRSALVAALFAVHPLRAESVAWVTERKDVLAGFFGLLAMHAYVTYARRPAITRYILVVLLFALSLLSKPMLVMLPVLLLGLDYWPLRRAISLRRAVMEKVPLAVVASLAALAGVFGPATRDLMVHHASLGNRAANALVSYVRYLGKMVWFRRLALSYPLVPHWPVWAVAGAMLILAGITVVVLWQVRRRPWLAVGWLWYVILMVPAAGVYALTDASMADRYTYFPMIGLLIGLAWMLPERLARPGLRVPVAAGVAAVLVCLIVATRAQVLTWRDDITLFRHAVDTAGPSELACGNLAIALTRANRASEAVPFFDQALQINPREASLHADLATALDQTDNHAAAVPHYLEAVGRVPDDSKLYYNLGTDLIALGRPHDALRYLQRAVELDPGSIQFRANLATALLRSGDFAGAIGQCNKTLEADPGATGVRETLASALAHSGRQREAETQYQLVILNDPHSSTAYNELGALCAARGQLPLAISCFKQALNLNPRLASAHNNLGVALAQRGQFKEAANEFRKALEIQPGYEDARRNLDLAEHSE